jgi:hypothetical protein
MIEYLQTKYLDGHSMIWKNQAEQLIFHNEIINIISVTWDVVFALMESPKKIKDDPRELDFDLEDLTESIDPIERTRQIITLAKIEALDDLDELTTAIQFGKSLLRKEPVPQNPPA